MSHTALRRVVIRLLHDPALANALIADPDAALAGADLSAEERAWLSDIPAAAWRTDPDRPRRVLAALAEEYAASIALAPARPEGFFRSSHFHAAVQERGSLAVAFGHHMADDTDGRVAAVARLELATAAVRRAPRRIPPSPPSMLRLTPRARVVRAAGGSADVLAAIRAGTPPPVLASIDEAFLVVRTDTLAVTIERLEDGLATLLDRADVASPRSELEALVVALGGTPGEATSVVEGLRADALLV